MIRKGRRPGVATLAFLGTCLGLAGCVNTQSAVQPMLSPNAQSQAAGPAGPAGTVTPGGMAGRASLAPNGPNGAMLTAHAAPGGEIQRTAYFRNAQGALVPASMEGQEGTEVVTDGVVMNQGMVAQGGPEAVGQPLPGELKMVSHPPHRVAPPDILKIDALRLIPRGPYKLDPLEVITVNVTDTLPNQPIAGNYIITPEGTVNLGYTYGTVRIGGMTIDQAQEAVRRSLGGVLKNPTVNISVAQFRGIQQIAGDHLVRPDGTISLGLYGSVYVAGLNLGQVKCVVEKHLEAYLVNPQVAVDVFAYNSRKIYVIVDGGGFGQQIIPLPSTGNETVLDAISSVQGLAPVSSKHRIWLARPSPCNLGCNIVLPVDWNAITQGASTCTNYQLFPGDRVYVSANRLIALNNYLSQALAPIEQIFGAALLGTSTVNAFSNNNGINGGSGLIVAR